MSSSLPPDFSASVTNWKGTRTINSSVAEVLGEAQSLANEVISKVNAALDVMEDSGNSALEDAVAAIDALGRFSPHAIHVDYSPPGINNPGFLMPNPFTLTDSSGQVVTPATGEVTVPIATPAPPTVGGTPPVSGVVTFGAPPTAQTFYAPPAPSVGDVKDVGEPPPPVFTAFSAVMPLPPALRELVLPTFTPQPFPDYVPPVTQDLPGPPVTDINIDDLLKYTRVWGDEIIAAAPRLGGVLVRDLVTQRDIRNSVETWRIRGCPLDEAQEQYQIDYADEITRLMNQAESRQLIIDEGLTGAEVQRIRLGFVVHYEALLVELAISVAKVYFEAATAQAEAQLMLAKAMTAYYSALVAEYAADADLYKLAIEEEVAKMKYWEALVHAEEAKVKANEQMTKLYVETEQVETIEADVYQSQVGALMAQVERYKATIEAIAAKAEVAKTGILVYRGETDAYAAGVQAYKAHFDEYAARARSVSAQNQAQQQASDLSLAEATRVAAEAAVISTNIEVAAEQLKAQAIKISSTYEAAKMTNAVEASRAQIASSSGRIKALRYTADKQTGEIPNEAASAYANQAARYYNQASDAAYRASEQTLKAITAATQAAAVAQDAAGRTSAALSQGALSAVHISAGLQGTGRLAGAEGHYSKLDEHISDMLTYTESKTETLSA